MLAALADTHSVLWYVYADPQLSATAKLRIDQVAAQGDELGVSAISLAEVVYLVEKGRIPLDAFTRLIAEFDTPRSVLVEVPIDRHVAKTMQQVARSAVPDLPDRIIAATALHLGVPVISRDHQIRVNGIQTIW